MRQQTELSFEFFPPKTADGVEKLCAARAALSPLQPAFVSVTFGAGGSTYQGTLETTLEMASAGLQAAPHLSCIGSSRASIREVLAQYRAHGIRQLVALRGDLPSGMGAGMSDCGEFCHANELVELIRAETGDWFQIKVAAYPEYHPQSQSSRHDLENFVRKIKAGADAAITQYFYDAEAYFHFVDDVRRLGVDVPIVPGVMPITNYRQLMRFSAICGADVPRWMARRLESFGEDRDAICAFGLDVVTNLCRRLLAGGAPGLHFYTLNSAAATQAICRRLAL